MFRAATGSRDVYVNLVGEVGLAFNYGNHRASVLRKAFWKRGERDNYAGKVAVAFDDALIGIVEIVYASSLSGKLPWVLVCLLIDCKTARLVDRPN